MTPSAPDTARSTVDQLLRIDLVAFTSQVSATRGRPMVLLPVYTRLSPTLACLPWLRGLNCDYVLIARAAAAPRRILLAVHTIGHLVLAHQGTPIAPARLRQTGLPDMDWPLLHRLLGAVLHATGPADETQAAAYIAGILHWRGLAEPEDRLWEAKL